MTVFGTELHSELIPNSPRSVIGDIERTVAGNLALRIGKTNGADTWSQTEHVVLTQNEVGALLTEVLRLLKDDLPSPHQLAASLRERAEQEAEERDVPIDQICVVATPFGAAEVIDLGEPS